MPPTLERFKRGIQNFTNRLRRPVPPRRELTDEQILQRGQLDTDYNTENLNLQRDLNRQGLLGQSRQSGQGRYGREPNTAYPALNQARQEGWAYDRGEADDPVSTHRAYRPYPHTSPYGQEYDRENLGSVRLRNSLQGITNATLRRNAAANGGNLPSANEYQQRFGSIGRSIDENGANGISGIRFRYPYYRDIRDDYRGVDRSAVQSSTRPMTVYSGDGPTATLGTIPPRMPIGEGQYFRGSLVPTQVLGSFRNNRPLDATEVVPNLRNRVDRAPMLDQFMSRINMSNYERPQYVPPQPAPPNRYVEAIRNWGNRAGQSISNFGNRIRSGFANAGQRINDWWRQNSIGLDEARRGTQAQQENADWMRDHPTGLPPNIANRPVAQPNLPTQDDEDIRRAVQRQIDAIPDEDIYS